MKALGMAPANRYPMASELQRALENAMVEAEMVTTSAAVAAFIAENAAESAQKRKNAIALGLKNAADRSSSALPLEPPGIRSTSSIPPPATGSTMRAAAVEVTPAPPSLGRAFPTVPVVLGSLVVLAAVGITARLTRHPAPSGAPAAAPAAAMAPPPATGVQGAPVASAPPAPTSAPPGGPNIRTVDFSELPAAPSPAPAAPPTPAAAPRPPVASRPVAAPTGIAPSSAAPVKPPPAPARSKPDDGF
jgi:hypothetical protein